MPNPTDTKTAEEEDTRGDDGDGEAINSMAQLRRRFPKPVYIANDLTRSRAKVAFSARNMSRQGHISDTWVFVRSIFFKDNSGHLKKNCATRWPQEMDAQVTSHIVIHEYCEILVHLVIGVVKPTAFSPAGELGAVDLTASITSAGVGMAGATIFPLYRMY